VSKNILSAALNAAMEILASPSTPQVVAGTEDPYLDGAKLKRLHASLLMTDLRERVWSLGEALNARAVGPGDKIPF
jgi:hypothetical protein